jgi:hypothetical protein
MRTRATLPLLLALVCAGAAPRPAEAQVNRLLWVVQTGYVGDALVATGFRWIYTPAPRVTTDPVTGMVQPVTSRSSLHASATGGVSVGGGRERTIDWIALGSAGVVRPIGVGPISGVGVVAMGALQPDGVGPGVRLETGFQAIGVNAGVLFGDGPTRGAAAIDLSGIFLRDIFR